MLRRDVKKKTNLPVRVSEGLFDNVFDEFNAFSGSVKIHSAATADPIYASDDTVKRQTTNAVNWYSSWPRNSKKT